MHTQHEQPTKGGDVSREDSSNVKNLSAEQEVIDGNRDFKRINNDK